MQLKKTNAKNDEIMIREAVGIFSETADLQKAMDELLAAGFERTAFGLLAGEHTVQSHLHDLYQSANEFSGGVDAPNIAFFHKDTNETMFGNLYFMGGSTLAGAAVLTAGALGGAILAATTGALAVGAVGAIVGMVIHQSDAEYLEDHVNAGHLVFFVRVLNSSEEAKARDILAKHSNFDKDKIKVLTVPANDPELMMDDRPRLSDRIPSN
jgi:hypothetical protein